MSQVQTLFFCFFLLIVVAVVFVATYLKFLSLQREGVFGFSRKARYATYGIAALLLTLVYFAGAVGVFDLQGPNRFDKSDGIEISLACLFAAIISLATVMAAHLDYVVLSDNVLASHPLFGRKRQIAVKSITKIGLAKSALSGGFDVFTGAKSIYISGGIDHSLWHQILRMQPSIEITKMAQLALDNNEDLSSG